MPAILVLLMEMPAMVKITSAVMMMKMKVCGVLTEPLRSGVADLLETESCFKDTEYEELSS